MISRVLPFLLFTATAWASTVNIWVTDEKAKDCPAPKTLAEETRYLLKPKDAAAALKRYVESKKNPELYDAAFVNAGLRFCSPAAALVVFKQLADAFKRNEPGERAWEVLKNYKSDPSLLDAVEDRLKDKKLTDRGRQNLINARGMLWPKGFDPKKANKYH